MQRIAIIGSGISGLAAARALTQASGQHHVTLFESADYFGGHAHTVDVSLGGITHGVDTGFLVYNERTYPQLLRLFSELGVATAPAQMSFSVQAQGLEWSGVDLASVFAQRRNLLRPAFWGMLADIVRFNQLATRMASNSEATWVEQSIGEFLTEHRFGSAFRNWYFLPMIACIWSCPSEQMLAFPMATLIRFCHNHGLLQITKRPQWYTVRGGSRQYVQAIVAGLHDARLNTAVSAVQRSVGGVRVHTANATESFDQVIFACHTVQTLRLLGAQASASEKQILGAIQYQSNRAVLHTDAALLPSKRSAWAAWNYESGGSDGAASQVCLHYLINHLQPLPWQQPVIVSLNPLREPRAGSVLQSFEYEHPVFDAAAIATQARLHAIQGHQRSWYCGAWSGYGFHEDGLKSGLAVAQTLLAGLAQPQQN